MRSTETQNDGMDACKSCLGRGRRACESANDVMPRARRDRRSVVTIHSSDHLLHLFDLDPYESRTEATSC